MGERQECELCPVPAINQGINFPEGPGFRSAPGGGRKELCLTVSVLPELCFKECLEQFREFQVEKSVFFVVGRIMPPTKSTS